MCTGEFEIDLAARKGDLEADFGVCTGEFEEDLGVRKGES